MTSQYTSNTKKKARPKSAKMGFINLTDLMRIQREIIPSINEEKNRQLYNQKLKEKSEAHILNFKGEGLRVDKHSLGYYNDRIKNQYINEELRKRKIDEIEKEFAMNEKKTINDRAKKIIFQNLDDIKNFRGKMLLSDCMNERKYQQEIKRLQKATNDMVEEKYYEQSLENMEKYDKKEKAKKDLLNKKKKEQIKIINEQIEDAKIKKLQEYQEKEIEGFMARQDYLDGVKEDQLKAEQEKQRKNKLRDEFIQGNEEAKIRKKNRMLKEIEDEKRREEFRLQKDRLEEVKKKKAEEIMKRQQNERQKMIDRQYEYLLGLQKKEEKILEKQKKEEDEKQELEEKMKSYQTKLKYENIENNLKIRKPGHIYRILCRLEVDANLIDNKVTKFLLKNNKIFNKNGFGFSGGFENNDKNMHLLISQDYQCFGCCKTNKKFSNLVKNDLKSFLKRYGLLNFYQNFYHNGFELIEYVILQMYGGYPINDEILENCFHVYEEEQRKKILKAIVSEMKKINEFLISDDYNNNENMEYAKYENIIFCNDQNGEEAKIIGVF